MGQGGADDPAAVDMPGMREHEARQVGRIPGGKGRSGQRRPLFQERLHFGTQIGRDIGIKTACDSGLAKMHGGILPKRSWTGRSIAPAADKDQQHRGSFPDRERQIWAEVR